MVTVPKIWRIQKILTFFVKEKEEEWKDFLTKTTFVCLNNVNGKNPLKTFASSPNECQYFLGTCQSSERIVKFKLNGNDLFQTNGQGGPSRVSVVVVGAWRRRRHRAGPTQTVEAESQMEGHALPGSNSHLPPSDAKTQTLLWRHLTG